jgi:hypothetical protein
MFLLGKTEHGVYRDELSGVHPDVISQYYGVDRAERVRVPGQTGAGHPPDEEPGLDIDELEWEDVEEQIAVDQDSNFHHEAVAVPKHTNLFNSAEAEDIFKQAFNIVVEQGILPEGYGLLQEDWDDGEYPSFEMIRSGRRSGKELRIALPDFIWRRRAEVWGQALDLVNRLTYMNEEAE